MRSVNNQKNSRFAAFSSGSPGGFALVAALLAIFFLTALGLAVFTVSTRDVRISSRVVGEKKAFSAAEAGVHQLSQNFDPENLSASIKSLIQVDPNNDPDTRYTIAEAPSRPTSGPATVPLPGYAIGGGQIWGQERYMAQVTGVNTRYQSNTQIDVGLGFGPVEITTVYR
jgi:Tfp pilus assembly protein PilX